MPWFRTLRVRFALWVAALVLATVTVFGAFVYLHLERSLKALINDSLQLSASQSLAALEVEGGRILLEAPSSAATGLSEEISERGPTTRVLDPSGQVIQAFGTYRALPVNLESVAAARRGQDVFDTAAISGKTYAVHVYTVPIMENDQIIGVLQVAQDLKEVDGTLTKLLRALLIGGVLSVSLASAASFMLVARTVAPIDRITRTARRISVEDLSARLGLPATDDEIGRLVATFDDMLARLKAAFQRERRFTADASHELRTPLAALQAILGVTLAQRRTPEAYEEALADIGAETERMTQLVEGLLDLARNGAPVSPLHAAVNLGVILDDVCEAMRPLADMKGLSLTSRVPDGLTVHGDKDGLIRLFVNLVDNAVKYTGVTGSVARIAGAFGAIRGYADPAQLVLEFYTIDVEAPAAAAQLRDVHRLTRDCNAPSG